MGPFYTDWQFWAVIVAAIAVLLSQLPPIHVMLRPRRLSIEVHSRIQITHTVGNPNVSLYVSISNTGGRALQIRALRLRVLRDGKEIVVMPAQSYLDSQSAQAPVLFVPFSLKPNDQWGHSIVFVDFFDRQDEKEFREAESALREDINTKLEQRPKDQKKLVEAEKQLVEPFMRLYKKNFVWTPGEYMVELVVETEPSTATQLQRYRFTLYESDSAELERYKEDYKYGGGIYYKVDRHTGLFVPLLEHKG